MTTPAPDPESTDGAEPADVKPAGIAGSEELFAQVYNELRAIAHARLRGERSGYTLQSTELVHEAYMRLGIDDCADWESRGHFFAAAAEAMRRVLIERARAKGRVKRGGNEDGRPALRVSLDLADVAALDDGDPDTILALDRAIERLAVQDERVARVVKLRFYSGLTFEEIAQVFETSSRTIWRDWAFARAWLCKELSGE